MPENHREELQDLIPSSCQDCRRAVVAAALIAMKASEANVPFERAADEFQAILDEDCVGPGDACSTIECRHKNGSRYLFDSAEAATFD